MQLFLNYDRTFEDITFSIATPGHRVSIEKKTKILKIERLLLTLVAFDKFVQRRIIPNNLK